MTMNGYVTSVGCHSPATITMSRAASLRAAYAASQAAADVAAHTKFVTSPSMADLTNGDTDIKTVVLPLVTQIDDHLWLSGAKIAHSPQWLRSNNIGAIVNAAHRVTDWPLCHCTHTPNDMTVVLCCIGQDGITSLYDRSFDNQLPVPPSISPITGTTLISHPSSSSSSTTSTSVSTSVSGSSNSNINDDDLSITYLTLNVFDADSPGDHSNIAQYFNEVIAFIERYRGKHRSTNSSSSSNNRSGSTAPTSTPNNDSTPTVHVTLSASDTKVTAEEATQMALVSPTVSVNNKHNNDHNNNNNSVSIIGSHDGSVSNDIGAAHQLSTSQRTNEQRHHDGHGSGSGSNNNNDRIGVLVHCHSGVSRAPSLILAWLMSVRGWTLQRSLKWLQSQRPQVLPNNGFMRQLIDFERRISGRTTLNELDYPQPIVMGAPS
jgi:hypothetical protein